MQQLSNSKTFAIQANLGLYCRTGMNEPPTSIQEHTFHYRRLVFSVVKETIKSAFPIARKLVGKKAWLAAVVYFFENHKCQTPYLWRLPQEFNDFYQHNNLPKGKAIPFLKELLQYEWLEIEIFMMEDFPEQAFKKVGCANDIYVPNPEIKILSLQYPIHIKDARNIVNKDMGQYFVSVHRDYYSKQVKFSDLSYAFVELIVEINERETTRNDLMSILLKYETNINIVMNVIHEFEIFAFANNLVLGYKL